MVNPKVFTASNLNDFVDAFQPFTVGMDRMLRDMYSLNSRGPSGGYPPYNIVTIDEDHFLIEMAVAGFGEDEIEVSQKDEDLIVKGTPADKDTEADTYLHKGIASRSFNRKFKLGQHVKVVDCTLENGMLHVNLEKVIPEEEKPRVIPINK